MASGWTPPDTPIGAADSGGWKPPDTPHSADPVATTQKPTTGERILSLIPGAGAVGELGRGVGEEFSGVYGKRQETPFTALGATLAQLVRMPYDAAKGVVEGAEKGGEALAGRGEYRPGDIAPPETTQSLVNLAGVRAAGLASPASLNKAVASIPGAATSAAEAAATIPGKVAEAAKSLRTSPEHAAAQKATATAEKAAKKVSKSLSGGGAPAGQDIIEELGKAKKTGQPLTLADIESPDIKNMIGNIYRQGGAAAKRIADFFKERNAGATGRVEDIINSQLSDGSLRATAKQLAETRSANARPLWEKAMAHGPVWTDRLQELLDQPEIQQGIRKGFGIERRKAVGRGEPFNPKDYAIVGFDEAGDPVMGPVPNMRLLAVAKEGLDSMLEGKGMRDKLTGRLTKRGQSYLDLRNGLVKELDSLNSDYKIARNQWAGDTANMRALADGRNIFNDKRFSIEEIPEHLAEMSESERQFFTLGVASRLKAMLYRKVDAADKGSIINTEDARRRITPLFGSEEAAEKFLADVERERVMKQTPTKVTGGAPTAERFAVDEAARNFLSRLAHHGWSSAVASTAGQGIKHAMEKMGQARQAEVNDAIARILTDPNVARQIWANKGKTQIVVPPPQ